MKLLCSDSEGEDEQTVDEDAGPSQILLSGTLGVELILELVKKMQLQKMWLNEISSWDYERFVFVVFTKLLVIFEICFANDNL